MGQAGKVHLFRLKTQLYLSTEEFVFYDTSAENNLSIEHFENK
ncbi:hypothetical protein [Methanosalsum natronophilum]|nr:hypothetical protein [Methanosalsum natronophilum]